MSFKRVIPAVAASAVLVLSFSVAANATGNSNSDRKVGICHATGSSTNPYVFITVDKHAVQAHERHQAGRDVIGVDSKDDCPKEEGRVSSTSTNVPSNQGDVLSESVTELPKTGVAAVISPIAGLATLGYTAIAYLRSRK